MGHRPLQVFHARPELRVDGDGVDAGHLPQRALHPAEPLAELVELDGLLQVAEAALDRGFQRHQAGAGVVAPEGLLHLVQPFCHRAQAAVELRADHALDAGQPVADHLLQQLDAALQLAVGAELAAQLGEALGYDPLEGLHLALDLGERLPLRPLLGQLGDQGPVEQLVNPRPPVLKIRVLGGGHRPEV